MMPFHLLGLALDGDGLVIGSTAIGHDTVGQGIALSVPPDSMGALTV